MEKKFGGDLWMMTEDVDLDSHESPTRQRRRHDYSPKRREKVPSDTAVGEIVKQLLAGGLMKNIVEIAKQQVAVAVGEASDLVTPGPSASRTGMSVKKEREGSSRGLSLLGSEVIDRFDPDDPDDNVDRWLQKIDQLGKVYGWSNFEMSTLAQTKLDGAAKRWFNQLDDYSLTWDQWKEELRLAFPRRRDFAVMLEELVKRRKTPTESMSAYFHAKLALCSRVHIKGEEAVSCIIRGLPEGLRANARASNCPTPEALYSSFLAGLDEHHGEVSRKRNFASKVAVSSMAEGDTRRDVAAAAAKKRCFNCQMISNHLSKDCPLPRAERCMGCGAGGHRLADCPERQNTGSGEYEPRYQDGRTSRPKKKGTQEFQARSVRGKFNRQH